MQDVRVLLWGLGEIGTRAARTVLARPGLQPVAAISHQVGADLGELLGGTPTGIAVVGDPEELGPIEADVCLLATHQRVADLQPQIEWLVTRGINVVASGEEMIYPWASSPTLTKELDRLAKDNNCTIHGTGVNPGFVMDALVLCMTSPCANVTRIEVTRSSDFSPYGPGPLRSLGVGLTPEEFRSGLADGTVDGHIGFRESLALIASALGWEIDDYREGIEPIISGVPRQTPHIDVPAGNVVGCRHWIEAIVDGEVRVRLDHPQQIDPGAESARVGDFVTITGEPGLTLAIEPEIEGGEATAARMVNVIHDVFNAPAGVVTLDQLPIPFARVGSGPQGHP